MRGATNPLRRNNPPNRETITPGEGNNSPVNKGLAPWLARALLCKRNASDSWDKRPTDWGTLVCKTL